MGNHKIIKGNCLEKIDEIPNNSIALTITSPPYFNAKTYGGEENNVGNNESYEVYLSSIRTLLKKIYDKTISGGTVAWNTSPVLDNGKRYGVPFDTNQLFLECGFELREDIVWVKPMGAAKLRCGGWFQNKGRPTTWWANINTEYIFVYNKPGKREEGKFNPIKTYYAEIPKDLTSNTWLINPETQKSYHDAPFPYEIPKRLILLYSYLGDTVLDPFAGTFTVSKAARDLERDSVGIELSEEYIKMGKEVMGFYQKSLIEQHKYIEK